MERIQQVVIEIIVDTNKRTMTERLVQNGDESSLEFLIRVVAKLAELTDTDLS